MRRLSLLLAALGTGLAMASGCSTVTDVRKVLFTPRLRECKGFDVPLSVFIGPSRKEMRARVVARNVDHDVPFVVETTADSLVVVGFTPLGTKAFTLERRGDDLDEVEVESFVGPGLTVPPVNFMQDILAMSTPSACGTSASEVGVTRFDDWEVQDTCSGGRLVVRNLFRLDDDERNDAAEDGQPGGQGSAGQTVGDGGGQTLVADVVGVAGHAPEEYPAGTAQESSQQVVQKTGQEAGQETTQETTQETVDNPVADAATDDAATTDDAGLEGEADDNGSEIEITYREDGIVVYQKRCRYRARYVLEAAPTEVEAEDVAAPEPAANAAATVPATSPTVSGEAAE